MIIHVYKGCKVWGTEKVLLNISDKIRFSCENGKIKIYHVPRQCKPTAVLRPSFFFICVLLLEHWVLSSHYRKETAGRVIIHVRVHVGRILPVPGSLRSAFLPKAFLPVWLPQCRLFGHVMIWKSSYFEPVMKYPRLDNFVNKRFI